MRTVLTCILFMVFSAGMAESDYTFELSDRAREYRFPRPLLEAVLSENNQVIVEIPKSGDIKQAFYYLRYVVICGEDTLQSHAFAPFPINAGGRFVIPQATQEIRERIGKKAEVCRASIRLHTRDKHAARRVIKVKGKFSINPIKP